MSKKLIVTISLFGLMTFQAHAELRYTQPFSGPFGDSGTIDDICIATSKYYETPRYSFEYLGVASITDPYQWIYDNPDEAGLYSGFGCKTNMVNKETGEIRELPETDLLGQIHCLEREDGLPSGRIYADRQDGCYAKMSEFD